MGVSYYECRGCDDRQCVFDYNKDKNPPKTCNRGRNTDMHLFIDERHYRIAFDLIRADMI